MRLPRNTMLRLPVTMTEIPRPAIRPELRANPTRDLQAPLPGHGHGL